uniref:Cyclin N-terminal domain-containing protein n=1 Tax=Romanomermis culicivorax TaxID=13658 RepID=A0A915IA75_ROMCU
MASLKDKVTTKLAPDAAIATKKTITAAAAGVTTRRAALGDIGNRVLNRPDTSKVGLAKKDSDADLKKPVAAKVDARRPLRSNSVILNTTKTATALSIKPPLNDISKNRVLTKQNLSTTTFGSQSKFSASNITTTKAEIHHHSAAPVPAQPPRQSILQKRESLPLSIATSASVTDDKEPLKDLQAYSVAWIPDIDADDRLFPQLVSEFVNEIYEYMRELEREQYIRHDFLAGNDITGRMRGILVDWLTQVHMRFHLLPETMYMTVMIIDRYLQKLNPFWAYLLLTTLAFGNRAAAFGCISCPLYLSCDLLNLQEVKVAKDQLQLVGITALFLASKYEEIYAPEIGDFVYIADNAYTKDNVRHMERLMLRTLGFNLGRPSAIHFLRRYSKAAEADDLKHTMAKFFLELSFQEYSLAHVHPSLVAAAALYLSQLLLDGSPWTSVLVHYTTYSEAEVLPIVKILCQIIVSVYDKNSKLQAVRNKYGSRKFLEISQHKSLSGPLIRQMVVKD